MDAKHTTRWVTSLICLCLGNGILSFTGNAQKEAAKIAVSTLQDLRFGAFFRTGGGGTVTVSSSGVRSASGDIILSNLGGTYCPAIFEVNGPLQSVVNILTENRILLYGSNGGSILLQPGTSQNGAAFILTKKMSSDPTKGTEQISVGGILSIGSETKSPAGNYSGSFSVTFVQE